MIDQLMTLGWIGRSVVLLYGAPLILCLVWFGSGIIRDVRADLDMRKLRPMTYCPRVRVGDVLMLALVSFFPVLNLGVVLFGALPAFFRLAWKWFNEFVSMPLVSDHDNNEGKGQ